MVENTEGDVMPETERRATADAHRGEIVEDFAEVVTPRRMAQMVSLRLEGDIVIALRQIANDRGISLSDLLREGADCVLARWQGSRNLVRVSYSSSTFPGRSATGSYQVEVTALPAVSSPEPEVIPLDVSRTGEMRWS